MREVYFDGKTKLHLQEYLDSRSDSNNALFVSLYKPYEELKSRGIELMLQRLGEKNGISKVHPLIEVSYTSMQATKRLKGVMHTQGNYLS